MNINLHHQLPTYDFDVFSLLPEYYLRTSVIFNKSWSNSAYGKIMIYDQFDMKLFGTVSDRSGCFVEDCFRCSVFVWQGD